MEDVRELVTFITDFPGDEQWNERGDLLVPGGRMITESIRTSFQGAACHCTPVLQHSFYGWTFTVVWQSHSIECIVSVADALRWMLQMRLERPLTRRILGDSGASELKASQVHLHEFLKSDQHFSNVLWYTQRDYDSNRDDKASATP